MLSIDSRGRTECSVPEYNVSCVDKALTRANMTYGDAWERGMGSKG